MHILGFESEAAMLFLGTGEQGQGGARPSVPESQGWVLPAVTLVLLAHSFHFQRKAEIPGVVSLFWAPKQDLKYVPIFVFYFLFFSCMRKIIQ